jgi:hypothetical protein
MHVDIFQERVIVNTVVPAMETPYLKIIKNFPHISVLGKIE